VVALERKWNYGVKRVTTRVTPTDWEWKYDEASHWKYSGAKDYEEISEFLEIRCFR